MTGSPLPRRLLVIGLWLSATLPLGLLLIRSVAGTWFYPVLWPPQLSAEAWSSLLIGHARIWRAFTTSLALGALTGVLAVLVGWPIGRALAQLRGWPRALGAGMAFLPVTAPPVTLGTGLYVIALQLGLAGRLVGVALGHLIPAAGYTALYFFGVFSAFDHRIEAEARTLGARPSQVLWRVTVPMVRGRLGEAFVLAFLVSWAQMALTLLLGSGVVITLPVEVFQSLQAGLDARAAAGALLLAAPPLAVLGAVRLAMSRSGVIPV